MNTPALKLHRSDELASPILCLAMANAGFTPATSKADLPDIVPATAMRPSQTAHVASPTVLAICPAEGISPTPFTRKFKA